MKKLVRLIILNGDSIEHEVNHKINVMKLKIEKHPSNDKRLIFLHVFYKLDSSKLLSNNY